MFKFAENLLNNLDQTTQSTVQTVRSKDQNETTDNAATKPTNAKTGSKHSKNKSFTANHINTTKTEHQNPVTSISASNSSANLRSQKDSNFSKSVSPARQQKKKQDEELFEEFLNSPEKIDIKTSSTNSLEKSETLNEEEEVKFLVGDKSSNKQSDAEESKSLNESFEVHQQEVSAEDSTNNNNVHKYKQEIASLTDEVQSLMRQIKTTQNDYQRARKKLTTTENQNTEGNKIIRELRSREEDLTETIKSKDSQLAVLRVRYTEIEGELVAKAKGIDAIKSEADRILKDHSNSSDVQSQAFETLKEKVKDLEYNLEKEKESNSQLQKEYMSMQSKLEHETHILNESLQSLEKRLNDEKSKNSDTSVHLKNAQLKLKASSNNLKQELDEYKLKATKTLQAKDRIIAQLKESSSSDGADETAGSERSSMKLIEIEELKAERDYLKDELDSKTTSIELLKSDLIEVETQTSIEIETLRDQHRSLLDEQEEQRQSKAYLEQDMRSLREQLDYAQEELYKQKSGLSSRLAERETEVERLRNQLTTKSLGSTTEKELENRLHMLTESLIQKQTLIEALQSEKHSIFLQLERSEKRLQDYESIVSSKNSSVSIRMGHGGGEDGDTHNSKEPIFRESPYDHEMTRKVKRAATEIDKFSIRLGVFLKKYPIARIFVLFYMFMLHLWVVVVLFTYTPEAHDSSFNHMASVLPHHPPS